MPYYSREYCRRDDFCSFASFTCSGCYGPVTGEGGCADRCGCCNGLFCPEGATWECDVCNERERKTGKPTANRLSTMCKNCISESCKLCGDDLIICKECLKGHIKSCGSREEKIKKLQEEIALKQSELALLLAEEAAARKQEDAAEAPVLKRSGTKRQRADPSPATSVKDRNGTTHNKVFTRCQEEEFDKALMEIHIPESSFSQDDVREELMLS